MKAIDYVAWAMIAGSIGVLIARFVNEFWAYQECKIARENLTQKHEQDERDIDRLIESLHLPIVRHGDKLMLVSKDRN